MRLYAEQRVHSWLSGLTVSTKIGLGFAIVLALHLSVVGLGHYGVRKAEHDRKTQSALLAQVGTLYEIERLVGELQRNVLLFASTGYDGPGLRVKRLQRELNERLDSVELEQASGTVAWINPDQLKAMRASLATQETIFEAVVVDRAKRRTLVKVDLRRCRERFDAALDVVLDQKDPDREPVYAAKAAFHAAQLSALRFVRSPDSRLLHESKQLLEQARTHLARLPTPARSGAQSAIDATNAFEAAFIQMVQATRGYLHLVNVVLAGESVEFLHLAEQVRNDCSVRANRLTADMQRDNHRFEIINSLFSILTIALGIAASWLIGRNVAPPLNAITRTIGALARGETCDTVPGVDRRDELGKLAHAAEVFRAKAADTERLLGEVTRMKDMERQLAHAQKLESMGQLAAGIAHEINTPMQAVASNVEFLSAASDEVLDVVNRIRESLDDDGSLEWTARLSEAVTEKRFRHAADQIPGAIADTASASERVIEILRAMKVMSHPGKMALEPVDINRLIADAATISRNRWKYAATLEYELDDNLPHPYALASAFSQVMLNLLVNAADAIIEKNGPDGPAGSIVVRTFADADSVYIEVEDSGAGVPEELRGRVFEPFFTTKEVGKGTGQGLAFCYDVVVKRHGGSIAIESAEPNGARFIIRLPIEPAVKASEAEKIDAAAASI